LYAATAASILALSPEVAVVLAVIKSCRSFAVLPTTLDEAAVAAAL